MKKQLKNGKMFQSRAKLISNKRVNSRCFHAFLEAPQIARAALPGQFVNVKVNEGPYPLLRRPLSIHNAENDIIELLYEVVGTGTQVLSGRRPGDKLDIIGPLGNGFSVEFPRRGMLQPILIAGGMGTAPLIFLAEKLVHSQKSIVHRPLVLIGGKTKDDIICEKEFKKAGCKIKVSTDDGSRGFEGRVTELFNSLLSSENHERRITNGEIKVVYACGPSPMLKAVAHTCASYSIPSQLSLEEHMACGIGACLGCVVKTSEGLKRACKEGPVFDGAEIIWE